jgi:DNA helicase-2/ATP-dependent DNA helicase PcrA
MVRGETQMNKVSRFVKEIPENLVSIENHSYGNSKGKIAYGGETDESAKGRFDFRANAKAALSRYGSGTSSTYGQGTRKVVIEGSQAPGKGSIIGYGSVRGKTNYAGTTNYASTPSYTSSTTYAGTMNYSNADRTTVKNVSEANPNKKAGFGKEFPMDIFDLKKPEGKRTEGLGYQAGDMVKHVKFGAGKVLSIENGPRDFMVTVDFDDYGLKKMLAGFAKLKKE